MSCGAYNQNIQFIADGEDVDAAVANRPIRQINDNQSYIYCLVQALIAAGGSGTGSLIVRGVLLKSNVSVGTPVFFNTSTSQYEPAFDDGTNKRNVLGICLDKTSATTGDLLVAGTAVVSLVAPTGTSNPPPGRYFLSTTVMGGLSQTIAGVQVCFLDNFGNVTVDPRIQDPIENVLQIPSTPSTDTPVTLFSVSNPNGYLSGFGTVINTGAHDLLVTETVTDLFNNTASESTVINGGVTPPLWHRIKLWRTFADAAYSPFKAYAVSVKSNVTGMSTTYVANLLINRF